MKRLFILTTFLLGISPILVTSVVRRVTKEEDENRSMFSKEKSWIL